MTRRTGILRRIGDHLPQLWLGGLAIVLSVAFVVAGTMVADSVRGVLVQQSVEFPLSTTAVLTSENGRVPVAAADIGLPATQRGVVLVEPVSGAAVAGDRRVLLAHRDFMRVLQGELPAAAGEVAVDPKTARVLDAAPGDAVILRTEDGEAAHWMITGIATPQAGTQGIGVTAAGMQSLLGPGFDSVLLDGDAASNDAAVASLDLGDAVTLTDVTATVAAQRSAAAGGLGVLGALLQSLTLVCAVAGTFVIANTFQVAATSRRREAALLRAVGATRHQVRRQFLGEALLLGLVASGLGALAGSLAGTWISSAIGMSVAPSAGLLTLGVALGMIVTTVGMWGPVRSLSAVSPIAALGEAEHTEVEPPSRARWAGAVPLLVLTGLALQVPIVGAVIGGLLTFIALVVLGPLLAPRIGSWVMTGPGRRGPVARIARANVTRYPKRSARTSAAVLLGVALATSTTALLSTLDNVQALDTRNEISVFAPTVTSELAAALGELDGVVEVWEPNPSEAVMVLSGPRADVAAQAAGVAADWPGAHVGTAEDRTSDLAGAVAWIAVSLGAVAAMSLLVGSVGVLNTVRLTTRERRREFAVLRAVGMTRRQLVGMVVAEASGLTGIGVVMGLILAAATVYGMLGLATLLLIPLISWWLIALICALLVVLVAVGSVLPARAAARVPPALAVARTAS